MFLLHSVLAYKSIPHFLKGFIKHLLLLFTRFGTRFRWLRVFGSKRSLAFLCTAAYYLLSTLSLLIFIFIPVVVKLFLLLLSLLRTLLILLVILLRNLCLSSLFIIYSMHLLGLLVFPLLILVHDPSLTSWLLGLGTIPLNLHWLLVLLTVLLN